MLYEPAAAVAVVPAGVAKRRFRRNEKRSSLVLAREWSASLAKNRRLRILGRLREPFDFNQEQELPVRLKGDQVKVVLARRLRQNHNELEMDRHSATDGKLDYVSNLLNAQPANPTRDQNLLPLFKWCEPTPEPRHQNQNELLLEYHDSSDVA